MPPYLSSQKSELKRWLLIVLTMNVSVHFLYVFLYGVPNTLLQRSGATYHAILALVGFHFGVAALVTELGGLTRTSRVKLLAASLFGVLAFVQASTVEGGLHIEPTWNALILISGLGALHLVGLVMHLASCILKKKKISEYFIFYIQLCLLVTLLGMGTGLALELTKVIFPATYDYHAYRIDAAFGGVANWCATTFDAAWPSIKAATFTVYSILVLCFYVVIGLVLRERSMTRLQGWRVFILPFLLAWFCYALVPVSGPIYAFFDGRFPGNLPDVAHVAGAKVILPPFARNGMPSFHLTGALLLWMLTASLRWKLPFGFASLLVLATVWSTMALGEHYAIDLVVALPFALSLGWTLINPSGLVFQSRRLGFTLSVGWLTFLTWMIAFVAAPNWLAAHLGFVRGLAFFGLMVSVLLGAAYLKAVWRGFESNELTDQSVAPNQFVRGESLPIWVASLFFASGFAGLLYEVVYAKSLALVFGSTSLAAYTVLTVYMGGMAFGAWVGGRLADRAGKPLYVYALCEAGIGLYAAVTPELFHFIQGVYVHMSLDVPPDDGWLTVLRVVLGAGALVVPTVMMGATLPLMFKYATSTGVAGRVAISNLYAANVIGAAFGSLVAGYVILPSLGRNGATYAAAVVSLLISLYAVDLVKNRSKGAGGSNHYRDMVNLSVGPPVGRLMGLTALLTLCFGGVVTLGLEVVSMHLLATVSGSSVYAFGIMLATFLFGLGLGSWCVDKWLPSVSRLLVVVIAQSGLALTIGVTAHFWDALPGYFGSFGMSPVYISFGGREVIRALVCAVAMVPGAFFIGFGYPSAAALASDWLGDKGAGNGLGLASCFNTVGNILGVLIFGFLALPMLGSRLSLMALACTSTVLAIVVYGVWIQHAGGWRTGLTQRLKLGVLPILPCVALLLFPADWNWGDLSSGGNVYFRQQDWGAVVDAAESVEGGITSVAKSRDGILTLLTNGKFQGNNSQGGEMQAQASFALLPLLHTDRRENALAIGYGTGMTARVLHDQGFQSLQVAELSRDLVRLADKHFQSINAGVSHAPNVKMNFADGRNFLLTQSTKFDLVSIELTSIWFSGAANLYNQEFYRLVKGRLRDTGVVQQWVQLHHMSPIDLFYILGSVRSEFKYVWVYFSGGQGVIVASNNRAARDNEGAKRMLAHAAGKLAYTVDPSDLARRLVAGPEQVDALIGRFDPTMAGMVSTDNNLYLEYSTPKGNALREDTVAANLRMLRGAR